MFFLIISYGGMIKKNRRGFGSAGDATHKYEHKFRTRTSEYSELFPVLR
jgi:hypothetical protein